MSFLPIVERELRAAARRPAGFWLRVVAALVTIIIAAHFLVINALFGSGAVNLGPALFATLTWMGFAAVLSAGLFLTSDCLSEEKREGTLGLLFLTDLRGYDVVLGKLLATSLRVFYGLLATLPILALVPVMGGVSRGELLQKMLALVNALFFSLAAGVLVSALSRNAQTAMAGTFLLLLVFVGVLPAADTWISGWRGTAFVPRLSLASLGFNFYAAGGSPAGRFWLSLAATHAIGWTFLGLASLVVPRAWQQKAAGTTLRGRRWLDRWKYGGQEQRAARRRRLLDANPVWWLAARERWQGVAMRLVMAALVGLVVWLLWFAEERSSANRIQVFLAAQVTSVIGFLLKLWMASQAPRFFIESRRSNAVELLLASPLTVREIIAGQWLALRRLFGLPLLLLLAVQALTGVMGVDSMMTSLAAPIGGVGDSLAWRITLTVASAVSTVADLIALGWFGMYMGLTSRNANFATLKTYVFVQIVPWFAVSMVSSMVMAALAFRGVLQPARNVTPPFVIWLPLVSGVVTIWLTWTKDVLFALWARRRLHDRFRELASQTGALGRRMGAPPVSGRPPVPPVIGPAG